MKYVKAEVSWSLEEAMAAAIRTHVQFAGKPAEQTIQTVALMMPGNHKSNVMVLDDDVRSLLPARSRGAVLTRGFNANLAGIVTSKTISLHPEVWDEYLEDGYINEDGNLVEKEKVEAAKPEPVPAPEPANPADVNGDGKVDLDDVAAVTEAAKEEQAGGAESSEEVKTDPAGENSEATPDLADAANEGTDLTEESVNDEVSEDTSENDTGTNPA